LTLGDYLKTINPKAEYEIQQDAVYLNILLEPAYLGGRFI
jgi:hypothetical protein